MSWVCICGLTNVNANKRCANSECKYERNEKERENDLRDSYDELLSDIVLSKIDWAINLYLSKDWRTMAMTPQEELFSGLFNHEKILVKDMDTLQLRAHREELVKIAFEARARLTAIDDEEKERKTLAKKESKPKGFERSVNTDEQTTDAINQIKERQKKLTKKEKIQAGIAAMYERSGMSAAESQKEAERLSSAGTILLKLKNKTKEETLATQPAEQKPYDAAEANRINPFAKKAE